MVGGRGKTTVAKSSTMREVILISSRYLIDPRATTKNINKTIPDEQTVA